MNQSSLANAELAVMGLLWQADQLTAREVREELYPDATNQHGTVQRLLQRLEEKGYISRDRSSGVHTFAAVTTREDYACNQLESLADKLTGGALAPLVTHLVEQNRISPDELDSIRAMLDAHEEGGE